MIKRDFYLNKLISHMWDGQIKVITGIRRCGKSVLLFDLFVDYLKKQGVDDKSIIQIQLDKTEFIYYRNPIFLCEYIEKILKDSDKKYYLLIDEIQLSKVVKVSIGNQVFENVTFYDMLNEINDHQNLDIYITGSNSKMLSSDILTVFRGRTTQIRINPLSFSEFNSTTNLDEKESLNVYMKYGGMPGLLNIKSEDEKKEYLQNLLQETYIKDLVEHGRINKVYILEKVLDVISSSISSLTNPNNIANTIESITKEKIDNNLIESYINKLEDAFLIKEVKRFDVKGKKYISTPNKYYYTDIGLRNARLNYRQFDLGHIMENIVYNELINRGYSVDIGSVSDRRNGANTTKEIDFVVNNFDKRVYIQCAYQINDDLKLKNEIDSLKLSNDFFKKIFIRNDIITNYYDENGIYNCSLIDFLLNRIELF